MTAATAHRLEGLEPDNLLAFLALLGLLRAIELTRPEWRPRAYWDLDALPLRPVLTTESPTTSGELSKAAFDGLLVFRDALRPFSWPRRKNGSAAKTALFSTRSRQRALAKRCVSSLSACTPQSKKRRVWELRCDLIACSGATQFKAKVKDNFEPTPLKLPSAQMTFIGAQFDLIAHCSSEEIFRSLFTPWTYSFSGNSLRFSPDEARRYAYRATDPSLEASRTDLGASALSGLGLLAFPMSDARPHWRMVAYAGRRSEGEITWPIWGESASLSSIVAMLRALPKKTSENLTLRNLAHFIASARRYVLDPESGDYGNISRARLDTL